MGDAQRVFAGAADGTEPGAAMAAAERARLAAAWAHREAAATEATAKGKADAVGPLAAAVTRSERSVEAAGKALAEAERRWAEAATAYQETGAHPAALSADRLTAVEQEAAAAAAELA